MKHGYLRHPGMFGTQPPHRSGIGVRTRLLFHAYGCRADGGTGLPPGLCEKCASGVSDEYRQLLKKIDKRAR